MEVNFNNLRKQACIAYDKLCSRLNSEIDEDGYIEIYASYIQGEMDTLRNMLVLIAMSYEENDPDMIDVWTDLYGKDGSMESFNEESDN